MFAFLETFVVITLITRSIQAMQQYATISTIMSYDDANNYCDQTYNTYLANIKSEEDQLAAYSICSSDGGSCWLSAKAIGNDPDVYYAWIDWISNPTMTLSFWTVGSPNNTGGSSNCIVMDYQSDGYWSNTDCTNSFRPLCVLPVTIQQSITKQYAATISTTSIWNDAESYCQSIYGTNLAIIKTENDQIAAFNECSKNGGSCWLSMKKVSTYYAWIDAISNPTVTLTYWADNEPSNTPSYSCVVMDWKGSGQWAEANCDGQFRALCELSPTMEPTIYPSIHPTKNPTRDPTTTPTMYPTGDTTNPTMNPTRDPTTAPTIHPAGNPTTTPTMNPTNIVTEEIYEHWIIKEGGNCGGGYTDLDDSSLYYGEYCQECPQGTAGTYGKCNKCDNLKEPNDSRTECVDTDTKGVLTEIVIALVVAFILFVVGAIYAYWKNKCWWQQNENDHGNTNESIELA